jgi:hypothetical protein
MAALSGHQQLVQKLPMKTGTQSDGTLQFTLKSAMSIVWLATSQPPAPLLETVVDEVLVPPPVPPAPGFPSITALPPHAASRPSTSVIRWNTAEA